MKITGIQAQIKHIGRYSIFVDGVFSFSLSDIALLDSKIIVGQELSKEDLEHLKQVSADDKAYARVLRYVMMRPRSEWEITQYMQHKQCSEDQIQLILNKLRKLALLDDRAFAASWVRSRRLLKPMSRRRLQLELRQKHIDDDTIHDVLAEDETTDSHTLTELVRRKRKQVKYQDSTKLMQYLARQGFNYDDIKQALATVDSDQE